jgi:hypothetical protein
MTLPMRIASVFGTKLEDLKYDIRKTVLTCVLYYIVLNRGIQLVQFFSKLSGTTVCRLDAQHKS